MGDSKDNTPYVPATICDSEGPPIPMPYVPVPNVNQAHLLTNSDIRNLEKQISKLIDKECWFEIDIGNPRRSRGRLRVANFSSDMDIRLFTDDIVLASMILTRMPGCCGVLISTAATVSPPISKSRYQYYSQSL